MMSKSWKNEHIAASPLPGCPDDLPQQRISEVVAMPDKPQGLEVKAGFLEFYPHYPVSTPRKLLFLGGVEWAWSPAHSRIDNYYLNPKRKYWVLWNHWLNDSELPWRWHWDIFAWAPKVKDDERHIAMHMLKEAWTIDCRHNSLDPFHWVNSTGALSVSDLQAIARAVWSPNRLGIAIESGENQ